MDLSSSAIDVARERARELPCRFEVSRIPPVPSGPFDVVLLFETMLAFPDKETLLRDISAALAAGGRFAFTLEEGLPLTRGRARQDARLRHGLANPSARRCSLTRAGRDRFRWHTTTKLELATVAWAESLSDPPPTQLDRRRSGAEHEAEVSLIAAHSNTLSSPEALLTLNAAGEVRPLRGRLRDTVSDQAD